VDYVIKQITLIFQDDFLKMCKKSACSMIKIIHIKVLRNTANISEMCHYGDGPIFTDLAKKQEA